MKTRQPAFRNFTRPIPLLPFLLVACLFLTACAPSPQLTVISNRDARVYLGGRDHWVGGSVSYVGDVSPDAPFEKRIPGGYGPSVLLQAQGDYALAPIRNGEARAYNWRDIDADAGKWIAVTQRGEIRVGMPESFVWLMWGQPRRTYYSDGASGRSGSLYYDHYDRINGLRNFTIHLSGGHVTHWSY